jgi:hypothetical protein
MKKVIIVAILDVIIWAGIVLSTHYIIEALT